MSEAGLLAAPAEVRAILVASAKAGEAISYSEPELAVLVVRQSDGLPGQGWWVGGARKHGYAGLWEGPQAAKLIGKLHRQAFEFWAGRDA